MIDSKIEEKINFYSQGISIAALLSFPRQDSSNRFPCVIRAHGYINSKEEFGGFTELANLLTSTGYCVFRFDFRGCGDTKYESGRMLCATDWPIDLQNAISFVYHHNLIESERIALIGQSIGGSTVSFISAFEDRVKTIISMAAVADGRKWLQQLWINKRGMTEWKRFLGIIEEDRKKRAISGKSKIMPVFEILAMDNDEKLQMEEWHRQYPYYLLSVPIESIDSVMNFRPINVIHRSNCPILFIHGIEDSLVPYEHSEMLFEQANTPKRIELLEGAGHDLPIGPYKEKVHQLILEWLKEWL